MKTGFGKMKQYIQLWSKIWTRNQNQSFSPYAVSRGTDLLWYTKKAFKNLSRGQSGLRQLPSNDTTSGWERRISKFLKDFFKIILKNSFKTFKTTGTTILNQVWVPSNQRVWYNWADHTPMKAGLVLSVLFLWNFTQCVSVLLISLRFNIWVTKTLLNGRDSVEEGWKPLSFWLHVFHCGRRGASHQVVIPGIARRCQGGKLQWEATHVTGL